MRTRPAKPAARIKRLPRAGPAAAVPRARARPSPAHARTRPPARCGRPRPPRRRRGARAARAARRGPGGGSHRPCVLWLEIMPLADEFQELLDALPSDWTDLELDLRVQEDRY